MKNMNKSLLLAALSAASLTLMAQDAPDGPAGHPRRQAPPLVTALDANQDGVIDASEIAAAATALATLDTNGDGQISGDETRPKRPEGAPAKGPGGPDGAGRPGGREGGRGRPTAPLAAALDVNQDGVMDATEIANAPASLATLDGNGDGQLTADELRPARPDGAPEGGKGFGGKRGPHGQRPPADGQ